MAEGLRMHHRLKHLIGRRPRLHYAFVLCTVAIVNVLPGCVTTTVATQMAWVRTDGRRITDDPGVLQQGKADIALCHADLDAGSANETARLAQRGYALVQKDQAEEVRAAYATAAQRKPKPPDDAAR
jgi:hypothetical protein